MPAPPIVYIVCSGRHRIGKTLLARVLIDYLLLDQRNPFVFDADWPDGPLRKHFPDRAVRVDLKHITGQMKLFDTILSLPSSDHVIDIPAGDTQRFSDACATIEFSNEARRQGFKVVVLYIVEATEEAAWAAQVMNSKVLPDLFVPVHNLSAGSVWPEMARLLTITMPDLGPELAAVLTAKDLSFRPLMLRDLGPVPEHLRAGLNVFLYELMIGFRDIELALSRTAAAR